MVPRSDSTVDGNIVDHEVDGADAEQRRAVLDVMKTGLLDKKAEAACLARDRHPLP